LNPIQEYTRDLSVAVIRQWAVKRESEAKAKWDQRKARRDKNKGKGKQVETGKDGQEAEVVDAAGELQFQFGNFPRHLARALGRRLNDHLPSYPSWKYAVLQCNPQMTNSLSHGLSTLQRSRLPPRTQHLQPARADPTLKTSTRLNDSTSSKP
jgi:hypothetical protein